MIRGSIITKKEATPLPESYGLRIGDTERRIKTVDIGQSARYKQLPLMQGLRCSCISLNRH